MPRGRRPSFSPVLTVSEAAAELGVSDQTIRNLIRLGELHAFRAGKKQGIRIRRTAIAAFEESRAIQPAPKDEPTGRVETVLDDILRADHLDGGNRLKRALARGVNVYAPMPHYKDRRKGKSD